MQARFRDDKFAAASPARCSLRGRERGGIPVPSPLEVVRTILRRDATTAREGPRIMYPEQEVEKIKRLVVINNPRLLAEQLASLRPQRRR